VFACQTFNPTNVANLVKSFITTNISPNFAMTGATSNWVGSPTGGGLSTDGTDDYVNCGFAPVINMPQLTVVAFVKFTTFTNAYITIVTKRNVSNGAYLSMYVKSNGKLALYLRGASANVSFYDGTGAKTLSLNTWYQITATYSTSSGLKGYVNGILDGSAAANGNMGGLTGTAATDYLTFGKDLGAASREMNGSFDYVFIYNNSLSEQNIKQLYSQPNIGILSPTYYTPS